MKVVIVGGGFAGVKTALELNGALGIEVTLISKHADFTYFSLGSVEPFETIIPLDKLFESSQNVTVVHDSLVALNTKVKAVKVSGGAIYQYDHLVLAIGRDKSVNHIPGLAENAIQITSADGVRDLYVKMSELAKSHVKKSIKIGIIGGGMTGVEIAGGVGEYLAELSSRFAVVPKALEVELYESSNRLLPHLHERASQYARDRLKQLGVTVCLSTTIDSCSKHIVRSGKTEKPVDIAVWAGGTRPSHLFSKYPDTFTIKDGRVVVDEHLRVEKHPDVFVIGDSAYAMYRGMAQSALHDAKHVAEVIRFQQAQPGVSLPGYHHKSPFYVVPIGRNWAIVQKGKKVWHGLLGWARRKKNTKHLHKHFSPLAPTRPSVM